MLMRNVLPFPAPRFAAGIDVDAREVRLVIASRVRREKRSIGVEWMAAAPLAAGVMCGARVVDRAAVSAALSSLCARWPRRRAMRGMPCAMATPAAAAAGDNAECNLDLEARVEVASAAGIALAAVDNEPQAALRALVHVAERALTPSARYAAIWAGYGGVRGWRVAEGAVRAGIRFPGGEADLESAFRGLVGSEGLEWAVVGGDLALLERVGMALPNIGECLGCSAAPFECAPFLASGAALGQCADRGRAAAFAVAFGLALRGVSV